MIILSIVKGNPIPNINSIAVNNVTPNSLAYQYNPTSGNSQNYINSTLLLAFNTSLDSNVNPDVDRFRVTSGNTQLSITNVQVTNNGVLLTFASSVTNQSLQNVSISYNNSSSLGDNPLKDNSGDAIASFSVQNGLTTDVSQSFVVINNTNNNLTLSDTATDYSVTVTNSDGTTVNNITVERVSLTGDEAILILNQNISPTQTVSISYNNQNISNSLVTGITPPSVTTQSLMTNIEADLGQDSSPFVISGGSSPLLAWVADAPPLEAIAGFVNSQIITLNFIDELGNGTDVPSADQFIISDSDNNSYTVGNVSVSGNSLNLTLDTAVSEDIQLNISYNLSTPTSNNTNLFLDNSFTKTTLWINEFSDFALTNTTNNNNPPVILGAGAIVENNTSNQITLVFAGNLTNNGVTNSDFTVESNGQVYAIEPNITVNGNTIILSVQPPEGSNLIGNGDIVTVSYTGDSLSNSNGNVVNFSNQPVITSPSTPTTVIKYALLNSTDSNLVSNISSIPGTGGFNFNPVGSYDSVNDITVLVWSNADSSDINTNLISGEFYTDNETTLINESFNQSDIYYSIYNGSSWSIASPIATQEGSEGKIVIGEGPNNQLMAAWINYNNNESTIYWSSVAYNNGEASWSNPEVLYADANPDPLTELVITTLNGKPTVLWTETQQTSYSEITFSESPLLYYRLAEASGTTLLNEGIYGAGGNGTYNGLVTFNEVGALEDTTTNEGDVNPAVLFNSGDSATSSTIPLSGTSLSVEFWFKVPSLPSSSIDLISMSGLLDINLTNSALSFSLNGQTITSSDFTPQANQWYYVTATYDGETNTANLYVNAESVASVENLDFTLPSSSSVTLASASNTSAVYLDEVAFYRQALTHSDTPDISDFGNLTSSQISQLLFNSSQIGNKYNSQYIEPLPSGPNTNYVTYNGTSWGIPSIIDPIYKPVATQLSDANKSQWDVTSATTANSSGYVNPNGNADIFLSLNLGNQVTGTKISSIEVTANNVTWSIGNTNGNQLAVVQGDKLLNPVNPNGSFDYTILSPTVDLDLFLDGGDNNFSSNTTFTVTINYSTGSSTTQTLQAENVTSEPTTVDSNQVLGIATVTEANDSSLALIDSGFIINTNNPSMGYSIASADFNNDGKSDVAVGNRGYTNTSGTVLGQGTIQILFGGGAVLSNNETNPLTTTDLSGNPNGVIITGLSDTGQANGDFPFSMATGDVNGDGYEDLVIGDPNANKVYVIYGSDNLSGKTINVNSLGSEGYVINAPTSTNIGFGYSVAVGNFNSNAQSKGGYATGTKFDIAIGAPGANNGNGAVYVAFDGNSTLSTIYNSTNTGELAGYSVAVSSRTSKAKTFTGNTTSDDLIIGAIAFSGEVTNQWSGLNGLPPSTNQNPAGQSYPSTSSSELGAVYVYKSNGTQTLTEYVSYTGPNLPSSNGTANNINAGSALNSADLDGDGTNDLAISAPGDANNNGVVYVLKGGVSKNSNPQNLGNVANLGIVGGLPFSQTGAIITSPGDVNNDGYEDFLITAPQGANSTGQGYLLFGPLNLSDIGTIFDLNVTASDSKTTFLLNGDQPYQLVGAAASGIGDVNGDGVDDLMISAPNAGQLYTVFGHPWLADDGSIKLADVSADNGFVIDGDLYTIDVDTEIYQIPNQQANNAPSFINNNGIFYLAYKGDDNNQIYLTTSSNRGMSWNTAVELPSDMTTNVSPSIAFYNGILYLAYQGTNNQLNITYSTNNGQTWADSYSLDQYSAAGYSLVEYAGELMVFFVTTQSDNDILYVTSSNPRSSSSWSDNYNVDNPSSTDSFQQASSMIGATVLNNTLYLAYRGGTVGNPNNYYVTQTNETTLSDLSWQVSEVTNANNPNTAPSLTNNGSQLYLTYGDISENIYITTSTNGTNWSTSQQVTNQTTSYTPTGAFLNGQLYLSYAGENQDIIVTALEGSLPLVGNGNNVVMLGDVNGDGFADVLSGGSANGGVLVFGNSTTNLVDAATGTDDIVITVSNQTINEFVALGDINGDGLQDLGVIDNNDNFYVQLGDRNLPTIGSTINLTTVDKTSIINALAVGDYNGDGYDDVVLRTSNGVWTLYHGSSSGSLNSTTTTFSGLTGNALGDINGDGYSDVGLGNENENLISPNTLGNGQFTIYQGNNQGNSPINPPNAIFEQALINSQWTPQYSLSGQSTDLAPTLIEFNGYLYMLYNGTDSDTLWMQRSSDGVNWEGLTNLGSNFETVYQASLAVFDNTLYLAFTATDNELILASAVSADSDLGLTFSGGEFYQIPGQSSQNGPTLVTYDNELYAFFLADNSNNSVLYVTSDNPNNSSSWSSNSNVPYDGGNNSSSDRIGATVFNDELYIAFKANNSNNISVTSYDGSSWSSANSSATSQVIPNQGTSAGPSLIATNETLYLFFKSGNSDDETIFYMSGEGLGENWTSDNAFIPNQSSSDRTSPAFFNQSIYIAHVGFNNDTNIYVTASNPIFETNTSQQLGNQLQGIGDFNGDGIEDYGVLAPGYATFGEFNGSDFNNNQGALFIYYGSTSGTFNSNPDVVLNPNYSTNPNGVSELSNFTAIGDANGDGYDDVVIASPTTALTSNDTEDGTVFVVFGGKTWGNTYSATNPFDLNSLSNNQSNSTTNNSNSNGFIITGLPSSEAGISLGGDGDINGDSFDDFIIGAPGDNDNLTYVIFGSDFNNTVTQTGTMGDDVMIGTATGESFLAGEGDDQIYTNGGIDVVYAGLGDDFVIVNDTYFLRLDGGAGTDVLRFEGYNGQDWNLTTLSPGSRLRNFEILVTEGYGANTLTLNSLSVTQLSPDNTVTVVMDENDTLNLSADFSLNGTVYQYNQKFDRYTSNTSAATVLLNRLIMTETETSQLLLTEAGSLVVKSSSGEQLWTATNNGLPVAGAVQALMQTDGNFVLYSQAQPTNQPGSPEFALWASGTNNNNSGTYLQLGGDGGLYIKSSSGQILSTLNSGNANISNPSLLNEQQELLVSDSLSATSTETTNLINVTKNAPSDNTPENVFSTEMSASSVNSETITSVSVDESGNETAQSLASSFFSATQSNPNAPTRLSVSNPTANEADGEVEFSIQRTGSLDKYVQVHYITQDGRGKGGSDYNPVVGKAVFKPGESSKIVSVPLVLDDVYTGTRDLGLLVTLEKESDTPLTDEFHLNVDLSNGQIRNWNHIIKDQPNSVMNGELEFRVITTDGKAEVKLYFEGTQEFNNYYIFNNETQQYEPFKGAKLFDENADGKYEGAILNLQDGSKYDVDGSENGIIFKRGFFANGESPEVILDTAMYRFRSLNTQGAYLYVGAEEKESVLTNYSNSFVEEGLAFYVSDTQEDDLIPFNRFRNTSLEGAYIYAGESESQSIRTNYPQFIDEGIAFYTYSQGSQMADNITRFQNSTGGAYLYTGQPETQSVIANYSDSFNLQGIAFEALLS